MGAQLGDGAEPHRPLWKLGLDRAVGVKRIGHAVDDAGFEDRGGFGGRRRGGLGVLRRLGRRSRRSFKARLGGPRSALGCLALGGPDRVETFARRLAHGLGAEQEVEP